MSDRIFGLVVVLVALVYVFGATQIQTSFLSDPVGPKAFPYIIAGVAILAAFIVILFPDAEPKWPPLAIFGKLLFAVVVLTGYAYTLKPLGFIIPTAVAAGLISLQIRPQALLSIITGTGLSVSLFIVFKYALGLGLYAFPKGWF